MRRVVSVAARSLGGAPMKRVFVSYSSLDRDVVEGVVHHLETAGFEVWFDQQMHGGQAWWDEILGRLRVCDAVVAMVTTAFLDSPACRSEVDYVASLSKTLIPIRLAEVGPEHTTSTLQCRQWIDYRVPTVDVTLELVAAVNTASVPPEPDVFPTAPPAPFSYLTRLTDKIDSTQPLGLDDQELVVLTLRQFLEDRRDPADVKELTRRFLQRDDILARVADRAETVLIEATNAVEERAKQETEPPAQRERQHDAEPRTAEERQLRHAGHERIAETERIAEEQRRRRRRVRVAIAAAAAIAVAVVVTIIVIARDPPDPDVTVPADQAWTDTGIDLGSGDVVEITSDGKITHNPNDPVEVGPDGDERSELREFSVLRDSEPRRPDRAHRCRRRRVPCGRKAPFHRAERRAFVPRHQ